MEELIKLKNFYERKEKKGKFNEKDEDLKEKIEEIDGYKGIWKNIKKVKMKIERERRMKMKIIGRMEKVLSENNEIRDEI